MTRRWWARRSVSSVSAVDRADASSTARSTGATRWAPAAKAVPAEARKSDAPRVFRSATQRRSRIGTGSSSPANATSTTVLSDAALVPNRSSMVALDTPACAAISPTVTGEAASHEQVVRGCGDLGLRPAADVVRFRSNRVEDHDGYCPRGLGFVVGEDRLVDLLLGEDPFAFVADRHPGTEPACLCPHLGGDNRVG